MKKVLKGTLAAAAATALLAGGMGTYATWNDSEIEKPGTVSTGVLKLEVGNGNWREITRNSDGTTVTTDIANIANFRLIPGDELVYSTVATVTVEGDNLVGTFVADATSLTATEANVPVGSVVVALAAPQSATQTFTSGTHTVPVEVRVTFNAQGQDAQGLSVNLGEVGLSLTQSS